MTTDDKAQGKQPAEQRLKQKASHDAEQVAQAAADKAEEKVDQAKRRADAEITRGGKAVEQLSDVVDSMAAELSDQDREGLASYARELSTGMTRVADQLQSKSVDELASDVTRLARNNPNAFFLGSIALGFGLSRFLKASDRRLSSSESQIQAALPYDHDHYVENHTPNMGNTRIATSPRERPITTGDTSKGGTV